ncbi:2-oxo acid dehydrogenase subunit E2 [candidate division KSB1 bacterium]|nr:2-oxo acid dehydrogenase subunit E2 [candidate division KSB1 bacterium]
MSTELKLPDLGENIESGTVVSILVKIGDRINKEQPIIELETEKAVLEVPADVSGVVEKILVKEGGDVKVGQALLVVAEETETAAKESKPVKEEKIKKDEPEEPGKATKPAEKSAGEETEVEIKIPDLGEGIESGTVANILVAKGDRIEKDQPLIELETEKAVVEIPAETAGTITGILVKAGEQVKIGQPILKISITGEPEKKAKTDKPAPETDKREAGEKKVQKPEQKSVIQPVTTEPVPVAEQKEVSLIPAAAAPSVRRFAREIGVDINEVKGTGPNNRISIDDVKDHSKKLHQQRTAGAAAPGTFPAVPLPDFSKWGETKREPMSRVREKTATHLSAAWSTVPHVTQFDKADITEMEKLRKQFASKTDAAGGKLTMTAILLKICAAALRVFPQFNASVDMQNKEIVFKKYINIGIAVDTDSGLLVPVIRDADKKNIVDLSVELTQIAQRARDRKLSLEEMQGGNFTISNLGGIGGTAFTPIVNAPEAAILGVSRSRFEPVYINGKFEPRLLLPLSLSYDHRVIDGADGARFIRWVVEAIEQPFKIVLEG